MRGVEHAAGMQGLRNAHGFFFFSPSRKSQSEVPFGYLLVYAEKNYYLQPTGCNTYH